MLMPFETAPFWLLHFDLNQVSAYPFIASKTRLGLSEAMESVKRPVSSVPLRLAIARVAPTAMFPIKLYDHHRRGG